MPTLLVAACLAFQQAPIEPIVRPGLDGRGRDPWVFRAVFEDRTRMVLLAPAPNWWMAFNPETGSLHKVWRGKMDFRGKVWDFSQDNSRAEGRVYFASPSEIWRLPEAQALPAGWTAQGVAPIKGGWNFEANGELRSPPVDLTGWHRIFVAFDETGRKAPFRVTIADAEKADTAQWFDSATHADSDTAWQWNFKRIERPGPRTTITVTSPIAGKHLRALRLYGDRSAWTDADGHPLAVKWEGYDLVGATKAVNIRYRLGFAGGKSVAVNFRPELTPQGWSETWTMRGLPKGHAIRLRREGMSEAVQPKTDLPVVDGAWSFAKDGTQTIRFDLPRGER